MSFKKVLIAVDESAFAAHAADVGIGLAKSLEAEIAFICVVDTSVARAAPEIGIPADRMMAIEEQQAKKLLWAFQGRAAASPPALAFLEIGKPSTAIVAEAKTWPADLIVIGSHGRGGVERLLLGSVAESVVRHAPCPVLVVRGRE